MALAASGAPVAAGPELPHWETVPDDLPAAIRQVNSPRYRLECTVATPYPGGGARCVPTW